MPTRLPLLNTLRRAFTISLQSEKPGSPPADELIDKYHDNKLHRRRFIGDVVKTGVVLGASGIFNACQKINELAPAGTPPTDPTINYKNSSKASQPKIVIIGAGMAGL